MRVLPLSPRDTEAKDQPIDYDGERGLTYTLAGFR
jgi:hypothetical protein